MTPITYSFTKEQLLEETTRYIAQLYGSLALAENKDVWLARHGLLIGFVEQIVAKAPG